MLSFASPCTVHAVRVRNREAVQKRRVNIACLTPPVTAARARLLDAISKSSKGAKVGEALQELIEITQQPKVKKGWDSAVTGRWGLRHTTEPPLERLLELGETKSYQLFRGDGGVVENVIEFSTPAVLSVGARYTPREEQRGFDFEFQTTRILFGSNAARFSGVTKNDGFGVDLKLPFAVGKGYVELIWLDHVLRIDKSKLSGKDVLNVYVYEGPVEKCGVGKQGDAE